MGVHPVSWLFYLVAVSLSSRAEATCQEPGPEPLVVSFEGGIGCGKTTQLELMTHMKDVLGVTNITSWQEPAGVFSEMDVFWPLAHKVDERRAQGLPIGEPLQTDVNEAALKVQKAVRQSYVDRREKAMAWACKAKAWGRPIVLLERTTGTQSHVFAPMLHLQGYLTDEGLKLAETTLPTEPASDFWLYYKLSPDQVMARISKRARQGESAINMYFVNHLTKMYLNYMQYIRSTDGFSAVQTVDASGEIDHVLALTAQAMWRFVHGTTVGPLLKIRQTISKRAREVARQSVVLQEATSASFEFQLAQAFRGELLPATASIASDSTSIESSFYPSALLLGMAVLAVFIVTLRFSGRAVSVPSRDVSSSLLGDTHVDTASLLRA